MCLNAMTGVLTVLYSNSSVQPIQGFGIGNRNDGPISVSEPNLFFSETETFIFEQILDKYSLSLHSTSWAFEFQAIIEFII